MQVKALFCENTYSCLVQCDKLESKLANLDLASRVFVCTCAYVCVCVCVCARALVLRSGISVTKLNFEINMDLNIKTLKLNAVSTGIQEGLAIFLFQVY